MVAAMFYENFKYSNKPTHIEVYTPMTAVTRTLIALKLLNDNAIIIVRRRFQLKLSVDDAVPSSFPLSQKCCINSLTLLSCICQHELTSYENKPSSVESIRSLQALRDKVQKSEETINFLLETIDVIKDVYEKSMRAADYIRIHQDRISAQNLLDYLDRKEKTDAVENHAKQEEKVPDKIVEEMPKQIENEISKRTEGEKQKLAQKICAEIEREGKILKAMENEYPKEIGKGKKLAAADTLRKTPRSLICVRQATNVRKQRAVPFCRIKNQRRVSFSRVEITLSPLLFSNKAAVFKILDNL
uniref:Uncharacterized protein n=1 Tax=Glossina palpalis gambiensis TaxID=67801 RepID=A0A1B0BSJ9_9MUSC